MPIPKLAFFCLILWHLPRALQAAQLPSPQLPPSSPTPDNQPSTPDPYESRQLEGWQLHIRLDLLAKDADSTEKALTLLQKQLAEIAQKLPAPAVAKLREVPLWFSPEYPNIRPTAEYHPNRDWLVEHHRNPAMAKGVEFTNIRIFEQETSRMPCFALHELAHAYHNRVLGFDHQEIKAAYNRALASKTYDKVERSHGNGQPNTFERAYAMTNAKEYFAESTEAYFGRNDFFPFTRDDLKKHDPQMFDLLTKAWGTSTKP